MFTMFDKAQFDEAGNFIYTYMGLGDYIATFVFMFAILLAVFKLGLTFRNYVYTGEFGDAEKSLIIGVMEDNPISKTWRYAFIGYHPGAIAADFFVMMGFAASTVFFWGGFLIGILVILLARSMRKRIAHKQTFIGNLKGEQLND